MNRQTTIILLLLFTATSAFSSVHTWTAGEGDWSVAGNWSGGVPLAGGTVSIPSGTVHLNSDTPALNSLTLAGTLVFSNWNTTLSATDVTIQSGGMMTCAGPFTDVQMSNNVYVVCTDMTIDAGGMINTDGKGYAGGVPEGTGSGSIRPGHGPGFGNASFSGHSGGAGHGGWASKLQGETGGRPYGSVSFPVAPGSGGRSGYQGSVGEHDGGNGGGAVRIDALGSVVINGSITAKGTVGGNVYIAGGGGSGGSISVSCNTLQGEGGELCADGGDGVSGSSGCGAGGRIAVNYNTVAQAVLSPKPKLAMTALPGKNGRIADIGSLWFPDTSFLSETLGTNFAGQIWGVTNWSPASLTVSNTWVRFPGEGVFINVGGDARVEGISGRFELGGSLTWTNRSLFSMNSDTSGPTLKVAGSLILTNGGAMTVYAAQTNDTGGGEYGAQLNITNALLIYSNSWIYLYAHPTNAGSARLRMRELSVAGGGGMNADAAGYLGGSGSGAAGYGPGGGLANGANYAGGAGHGGRGGRGTAALGGATNGSVINPRNAGSGGGSGGRYGGAGGGVIWIEAGDDILLNGVLTANGQKPAHYVDGGGAGGSVFVQCRTISGSGIIRAIGGDGATITSCGAGGGGRISVHYDSAAQGAIPVPGIIFSTSVGAGYEYGDIGSLWFTDNRFLSETFVHSGEWMSPGFTSWSPSGLTVSNGWLRLPVDSFLLDVSGDIKVFGTNVNLFRLDVSQLACAGETKLQGGNLTIRGVAFSPSADISGNLLLTNASLVLDGSATTGATLQVGGKITLSTNSRFSVYSGVTNGPGQLHGALVRVGGELKIEGGAALHPYSHNENGGSPFFRVGSMTVAAGGKIDADHKGYRGGVAYQEKGMGPGGGLSGSGAWSGGGGYGGKGGDASPADPRGGLAYGLDYAPTLPGSGGGKGYTGTSQTDGGGLVWVQADGAIFLKGAISANGRKPGTQTAGGGSGGGILLECFIFNGSGGDLSAAGADAFNLSQDGGGGGGRIAIWYGPHISELNRARLISGNAGEIEKLELYGVPPEILGSFTLNVNGGAGYEAGVAGTAVFLTIPPPSGMLIKSW